MNRLNQGIATVALVLTLSTVVVGQEHFKPDEIIAQLEDSLEQYALYQDYELSMTILDSAMTVAVASGQANLEAEVLVNRFWATWDEGDLYVATDVLQTLAVLFEENPDSTMQSVKGDYLYAQALYLHGIGDYLGAIETYQRVFDDSPTDSSLIYDTYDGIGLNFMRVGNPARALTYFEKALSYVKDGVIADRALAFQSIGRSLTDYYLQSQDSGLLSGAEYYLKAALNEIDQAAVVSGRLSNNRYSVLLNLSKVKLCQQEYDKSLQYLDKITADGEASEGFAFFVIKARGEVYAAMGNSGQALPYFQQVFQMVRDAGETASVYTLDAYKYLAKELIKVGRGIEAKVLIDQYLAFMETQKGSIQAASYANLTLPMQTVKCEYIYAEVIDSGDLPALKSAMEVFQEAIETTRQLRQAFPDRQFKEFLSQDSKTLLSQAMDLCHRAFQTTEDQQYVEMAYRFSELSKSLTLLEHIVDQEAITYAGVPDTVIEQGVALQRDIAVAEMAASKGVEGNLAELKNQYDQYIQQLERDYPQYYQLKYELNIPSMQEVQGQLTNEEEVLHYFLHDQTLYLLLINKQDVRFLKSDQFSAKDLNGFLNQLQTNPTTGNEQVTYQQFERAGMALSKQLLLDQLRVSKRQLITIPDGRLHLLPFETLTAGDELLMVETHSITYDGSLALYFQKKDDQSAAGEGYLGFAPEYSGDQVITVRQGDAVDETSVQLGRLLYNTREVEALQQSLGGSGYTGTEATKERFLQQIKEQSVFHLSAHGIYNDRSPLSSAIYFYQQRADSSGGNALYARELYASSINAELGILTSCDSGFGTYRTGEGLTSLRRAFYFAGCRSLVASLWQANDRATYEVTRKFGEQLALELPKDEALRNAKLAVIAENPAFRHPYYWANLTLSGAKQPLAQAQSNWWKFLFSILAAVAIFMIVKKSRSAKSESE